MLSITEHLTEGDCAAPAVVPSTLAHPTRTLEPNAVLYEAVSAFSTVGLSTGITAQLGTAGQLVLAALMLIGRLGPVTVASALALRSRPRLYDLPYERPIIG